MSSKKKTKIKTTIRGGGVGFNPVNVKFPEFFWERKEDVPFTDAVQREYVEDARSKRRLREIGGGAAIGGIAGGLTGAGAGAGVGAGVGTGIGAAVGSIVPGPGTVLGALVGAAVGTGIGATGAGIGAYIAAKMNRKRNKRHKIALAIAESGSISEYVMTVR